MSLSEFSPYIATAVTVTIWLVNQKINRNHEIFKERLKRRADLFDEVSDVLVSLNSEMRNYIRTKSNENELGKAFVEFCKYKFKMDLYGTKDEIECYKNIMTAFDERNDDKFRDSYAKFIELITSTTREDLKI